MPLPQIEIGSAVYTLVFDLSKLQGNLSAAETKITTFVKNTQTQLDSIHFNADKLGQQAQTVGQQVGQRYTAGIQQAINQSPVVQQPTQATSQAQRQIADPTVWQAASSNANGLLKVVNGLSGAVYKFGDSFVHAGQVAATSAYRLSIVLAPIGIGLALATKEAAAFETQMKLVKTQIDGMTSGGLTQLSSQVLKLSSDIGTGATDSAKALYYLVSSVTLPQNQVMGIMDAVSKASVATATDTEKVMQPVTIALNTFGKQWVEAGKGVEFTQHALDVMFDAVKRGRATFEDMITQEGRMIELGKMVGASFEEINATFASFSRVATPSQAATWIENLYKSLSDPKTLAVLNDWGIAFEKVMNGQIVRATPLEILDQIAQKQKELGASSPQFTKMVSELWGNIREQLGGLRFLEGLDEIKAFTKEMENVAGVTNEAYIDMADNIQFKFQKAWNNLMNLGIKGFLSGLKEPLSGIADLITALVQKFDSLSDATKGTVAMWIGLTVASPALLLVFSSLLMVMGSLVSAFGALMSPMGLVMAAIAAWAAGGTFGAFTDAINAAGGGIKGLIALLMALAVQFEVLDEGQAVQFMTRFGISTQDAARYLTEAQLGTGTFGTKVRELTSQISDLLGKLKTVLDALIQVGKFFADHAITMGIIGAIALLMGNLDKLIMKLKLTQVEMAKLGSGLGGLVGLGGRIFGGVFAADLITNAAAGQGLIDTLLPEVFKRGRKRTEGQQYFAGMTDLGQVNQERERLQSELKKMEEYYQQGQAYIDPSKYRMVPEQYKTLGVPWVSKIASAYDQMKDFLAEAELRAKELEKHPQTTAVDEYSKTYQQILADAEKENKLADERNQKEQAFLELQRKGIPTVDPSTQTVEERQKSQEDWINNDEEVIQKREDYNEKVAELNEQEAELEETHADRLNGIAEDRTQAAKDHLEDEEENKRRWQEVEEEHTKRLVELEDDRRDIIEGKINALTGIRETAVSKLRREYRDAIQKIVQDFNRERAKAEDDFNRSQADRQNNFNEDQGDRQTNLARELEDLERNHQERLQEIKDKAAGVELSPEQQEQQDYEKRKAQLQQDFDLQNQRAKEDFDTEQARAKAEFTQQQKEKALQFREQLKQEKTHAAERIAEQQQQDAARLAEIDKQIAEENTRYTKQVDELTRATDKMEEQYQRRVKALEKSVDDEEKQYAKALRNWQKNRDELDEDMTSFLDKKGKEFLGSLKLLFGTGEQGTQGHPDELLQKIGWRPTDQTPKPPDTSWVGLPRGTDPQYVYKNPDSRGFLGFLKDVATNTGDWFGQTFTPLWDKGWQTASNTVTNTLSGWATDIQNGLDLIAGHSIVNKWLDYLLTLWNAKFAALNLNTSTHLSTIKDTTWDGHLTGVSKLLGGWWDKLTTTDMPEWVGTFLAPGNFPKLLLEIGSWWESATKGWGVTISDFFTNLPELIKPLLDEGGELFNKMKDIGASLLDGVVQGIKDAPGNIIDAITGKPTTASAGSSPGSGVQIVPGGLGNYRLTTEMGVGYDTPSGWQPHNWGQDFATPTGTPLMAPLDATVESWGPNGGWGNQIALKLANGARVIVSHLSKFAEKIKEGVVRAGEVIGWTGWTGNVYPAGPNGAHLDIQTILANGQVEYPNRFFNIPASEGGGGQGGGIGGTLMAIGSAIGGAILKAVGGSSLGSPELYATGIKERNPLFMGYRSKAFASGEAAESGAPEYALHPSSDEDWEARYYYLRDRGMYGDNETTLVGKDQAKQRKSLYWQEISDRYRPSFIGKTAEKTGMIGQIDLADFQGSLAAIYTVLQQYGVKEMKISREDIQRMADGTMSDSEIDAMLAKWGIDPSTLSEVQRQGLRDAVRKEIPKITQTQRAFWNKELAKLSSGQLNQLGEDLSYFENLSPEDYKKNIINLLRRKYKDILVQMGVDKDLENMNVSDLEKLGENIMLDQEAEKSIPEGAPEFVRNPKSTADFVRRFYWLRRYKMAEWALDAGQDVDPLAAANKGHGLEPAWEATSDTPPAGTTETSASSSPSGGGSIRGDSGLNLSMLTDALASLTVSLNNLLTSIDLLRPDIGAIKSVLQGSTTTVKTETTETKTIRIQFDPIKIEAPADSGLDSKVVGETLYNGLATLFQSL